MNWRRVWMLLIWVAHEQDSNSSLQQIDTNDEKWWWIHNPQFIDFMSIHFHGKSRASDIYVDLLEEAKLYYFVVIIWFSLDMTSWPVRYGIVRKLSAPKSLPNMSICPSGMIPSLLPIYPTIFRWSSRCISINSPPVPSVPWSTVGWTRYKIGDAHRSLLKGIYTYGGVLK